MLKRILTFIQEKTSWLAILGLILGTGLMLYVMNWTNLPFSNPTIVEHSGGLPILDLRADFSADDAYELFAALGPEGRRAYLILHLIPDTLFPIGYALVFAFVSAWFMVRSGAGAMGRVRSTMPATSWVSTSSRIRALSVISAKKSSSTVVSVSAPSHMS